MQNRFARIMGELEGNGTILLAVSGGIDSMCMADLFLESEWKDRFAIAHCNFHLRGEESDADAAMVAAWARDHGVRIHMADFDTTSYASAHDLSIEMAARELRYTWFSRLCEENGYLCTAVAHNANDNAETLILNLLRGTGLKGMSGMKTLSALPFGKGLLFRPLLSFTRKQIEGYTLARRISYREDSSNSSSEYRRNRIRNEVFPIFGRMNPSFVRTLNRDIGYIGEASEIVDTWCRAEAGKVRTMGEDGILRISVSKLLSCPHWKYLLYHILEPYGFNSQTMASIEDLLESDRTVSGKRFDSPSYLLIAGHDALSVVPVSCLDDRVRGAEEDSAAVSVVRGPGKYRFNGRSFLVEVQPWREDMELKQPQGVLIMDAGALKFPFVCRRWRQGDWFVPLGMKGRKKVSDVFVDCNMDILAKSETVVIVDTTTEGLAEKQHVAGILGLRIDDRYKVGASTPEIIRITIL